MYKAQAYAVDKLLTEQLSQSQPSDTAPNTSNPSLSTLNLMQYIQTSTVDAFQGCEKDIIIICTSRTVDTPFISNPNRLNVAISRARNHLFVLGNLTVLKQNTLWKR